MQFSGLQFWFHTYNLFCLIALQLIVLLMIGFFSLLILC